MMLEPEPLVSKDPVPVSVIAPLSVRLPPSATSRAVGATPESMAKAPFAVRVVAPTARNDTPPLKALEEALANVMSENADFRVTVPVPVVMVPPAVWVMAPLAVKLRVPALSAVMATRLSLRSPEPNRVIAAAPTLRAATGPLKAFPPEASVMAAVSVWMLTCPVPVVMADPGSWVISPLAVMVRVPSRVGSGETVARFNAVESLT